MRTFKHNSWRCAGIFAAHKKAKVKVYGRMKQARGKRISFQRFRGRPGLAMALAILPFGPLLSDDVKLGEGDLGGKEERLVESDTEKRSSHVHVSEFEDWAQDHWHDYRLIRPDHTLRDETVKVRWQKHRQGRYERFELVVRTEKKQEILRRDIVEVGRHAARAWCTKFKDEADAYQIGKAKSSTVKVEGKTLVDWTMIYSCEFTGVCPGGNC